MAEWLLPAPTASSGAVARCLLHSLLHLGLDQCGRITLCSLAPQLHPVGNTRSCLGGKYHQGMENLEKQ